MPGFQFGHLATFSFEGNSVNLSIDEVAAEAARLPGSHPHVDEPLPPELIAGNFRPEEVPDEIRRRVAEAKAALKRNRQPDSPIVRIRKDTHVLEAQVHSHPIYTKPPPAQHDGEQRGSMDDPEHRERYLCWRAALVEWVFTDAESRGLEVLSVVEHLDEAHPHIHALSVPKNARLDAKVTHPGLAAGARRREQARARIENGGLTKLFEQTPEAVAETNERQSGSKRKGIDIGRRAPRRTKAEKRTQTKSERSAQEAIINGLGSRAYKAAMREWQDRLYFAVSLDHGLARTGPGLERLTRREWWQRQNQNDRAALVVHHQRRLSEATKIKVEWYDDASAKAKQAQQDQKTAEAALQRAELSLAEVVRSEGTVRERLQEQEARAAAAEADAEDANKRREAAEQAAKGAHRRAAESEAAAAEALRFAQVKLKSERTALEAKQAEIAAAEKSLKEARKLFDEERADLAAKLVALDAFAEGRLRINDDGILCAKRKLKGRPDHAELTQISQVTDWAKTLVMRAEAAIAQRVMERLNVLKKVFKTTVEGWAKGLVRARADSASGYVAQGSDGLARAVFERAIQGQEDLVKDIVCALPSLERVHSVQRDAAAAREILTDAEHRHLQNAFSAAKGLGMPGAGH